MIQITPTTAQALVRLLMRTPFASVQDKVTYANAQSELERGLQALLAQQTPSQ